MPKALLAKQLEKYRRAGFLVLEKFVSVADCDRLRARAEELVAGFDPQCVVSIFSMHEQTRTSDDYFLSSGDKRITGCKEARKCRRAVFRILLEVYECNER